MLGVNLDARSTNPEKQMIIVIGTLVAKEGQLAKTLELSLEHVHRSRAENGCISHAVHQDAENPLRLVFVEEWSDQAALTAHFAVPASRAFVKAVSGLVSEAPKIIVYEAKKISG